jgi:hypothetical protein
MDRRQDPGSGDYTMTEEEDDTFFKDFRKMQNGFFPSKKKMAVIGIGTVIVNGVLFVCAVGVIALAVKWVVS